jgi:hypothetical protein
MGGVAASWDRVMDRGAPIRTFRTFRTFSGFLLFLALGIGSIASRCDEDTSRATDSVKTDRPLQLGGVKSTQYADPDGAESDSLARPETAAALSFPVSVLPSKRHLVDGSRKPFLIQGDAAWSLIAQLTREEVDLYFDDRRARGFNTVLIELIEHRFSTNAPANAYGERPFLITGDYSTPNEQYFVHADWVLRRAAEKGLFVALTPSYTGYGGGSEGWYQEMVANGPSKLRQYGRFLGKRYRDFTNILWVQGGDYNPPDRTLVRAIAEGIEELDPRALHTAHCAPETSALEYWYGESWLRVNSVYTYGPVFRAALKEYARLEGMPFILIESAYENEHNATTQRLRTQAYQAVLAGAAGQIFGNNPIWHFDGPGLYPAPVSWQQAMEGKGTESMTHLHDLFAALPWWLLQPDINNTFLIGGLGSGQDQAVAARATDRSFAIIYMPSNRRITLDMSGLAGPLITARWYDPANGGVSNANGSPFPATGSTAFRPQTVKNSDGFGDWVLILESRS